MSDRDDDRARIRAVLQTINDGWLNGKPDELPRLLEGCFHEKVVFRGPNFQQVGHGAEAGIASLQEFMRNATIESCELDEPEIDLAGDTAIATFRWQMTYSYQGTDLDDSGYEIDVLTRDDEHRWVVRWRALVVA